MDILHGSIHEDNLEMKDFSYFIPKFQAGMRQDESQITFSMSIYEDKVEIKDLNKFISEFQAGMCQDESQFSTGTEQHVWWHLCHCKATKLFSELMAVPNSCLSG